MGKASEIAGIEHLEPFAEDRIVIIGFDFSEDDPDFTRLITALPRARVVSFTNGPAPSGVDVAPKSTARALLAARRIQADAIILADDARKLAVLGFAIGAEHVFVARGGCIIPRSRRSFLEERSPVLEGVSAARRAKELSAMAPIAPTRRQHFHIVSCSKNAGAAAIHCLTSVVAQDYPRDLIEHVYLDDASTDDTRDRIQAWLGNNPRHRVRYVETTTNRGGTRNTRDLFRAAPADAIVVDLNGDDWLPDPDVLTFLDRVYRDRSVWMTYNSASYASGARFEGTHPYDEKTVDNASYRGEVWRAGHLRTFRAELFDHIDDDDLHDPDTGDWWASADDQAIYLAMLELSGRHARHLTRTTYVYNHRDVSEDQKDLSGGRQRAARIRQRPAHSPLTSLRARRPADEETRVSILMPTYNASATIEASMQSIFEQSYRNIEFIVVDDGSTDETVSIAERIGEADGRVVVLTQEREGIAAALNYGLDVATGDIVARADVTDHSRPDRLARQVRRLHESPELGAVGSWVERVGPEGQPLGAPWQTPTSAGLAGWLLCFEPCFAPGAVAMRRRIVEQVGRYDTDGPQAVDYELWLRLVKVAGMANIPAPLVGARRGGGEDEPSADFARLSAKRTAAIIGRPIGDATSMDLFNLHRRRFEQPPKAPHLTFETLDELFRAYFSQRRWPASEVAAVRFDAAKKLLWLAAWCARAEPALAVRALAAAERIDREALVERGAHRVLRAVHETVERWRH